MAMGMEQPGRGGRNLPSINLPRQQGDPLEPGRAKGREETPVRRALSPLAQLASGTAPRGRTLGRQGLTRGLRGSLRGRGNTALNRFKKPSS